MPCVCGVSGSSTTRMSVALRNGIRPSSPWKVATPATAFCVRLQPLTRKPSAEQRLAAARPSSPSPMMPTEMSLGGRCGGSCQIFFACWRAVEHALAVVVEHPPEHIFGHVLREIFGDDAHDRHVGQAGRRGCGRRRRRSRRSPCRLGSATGASAAASRPRRRSIDGSSGPSGSSTTSRRSDSSSCQRSRVEARHGKENLPFSAPSCPRSRSVRMHGFSTKPMQTRSLPLYSLTTPAAPFRSGRRPRSAPWCSPLAAASKICSDGPCSTILPLRMTMTSLASARTTLRSWLMNR